MGHSVKRCYIQDGHLEDIECLHADLGKHIAGDTDGSLAVPKSSSQPPWRPGGCLVLAVADDALSCDGDTMSFLHSMVAASTCCLSKIPLIPGCRTSGALMFLLCCPWSGLIEASMHLQTDIISWISGAHSVAALPPCAQNSVAQTLQAPVIGYRPSCCP